MVTAKLFAVKNIRHTARFAANHGNLTPAHPDTAVNRPPERTVCQTHLTFRERADFQTDGVRAAPATDKFAIRDEQTIRLRLFHHDGALAGVRAEAEKVSVLAAILRFREFVADAVAEAERVENVLPVGARELERDALRVDPFAERIIRFVVNAERPEVDVFDVADVAAHVHKDATTNRVAGDIAHDVPVGAHEADGFVGIQE